MTSPASSVYGNVTGQVTVAEPVSAPPPRFSSSMGFFVITAGMESPMMSPPVGLVIVIVPEIKRSVSVKSTRSAKTS